jgi:uncharacterized protein with HEPN domain
VSRDPQLWLADMAGAARKALRYVEGMNREQLCGDERTLDAVIRNLEVIGEASKHIPQEIRDRYSDIEWRKISGLRDVLAHGYFGIDDEIIWDIVSNELEPLLASLEKILSIEFPDTEKKR